MASEPRRGDPVGRLTEVLGAAADSVAPGESGPTPREVAELLWLAGQLAAAEEEGRSSGANPAHPRPGPRTPPPARSTAVPPKPAPPPPTRPPASGGRVPLHLPGSPPRTPHDPPGAPLLAPVPPMLPHPLALQRALRPLKRKVPAPRARVLDEYATADRIARLGAGPDAWLPVLRPAPDRWLRLNLVYDAGPTMPVWRPLVRELHATLAQSGIFRAITLHPATPDGRAHHVPDPGDGRTVTLVVSDCMGPQWRPGAQGTRWYRTLHHWASRMAVAVLQPLPEHLWSTTALPAEPGLLAAPAAAAPTARGTFTPYDLDAPRAALSLPVLGPGPAWLAHWAALIAAPGGAHTPGAAAGLLTAPPPPAESAAPDIASLPPQDLVLHFRSTASAEAFRLAGHLSLANPSLPVMRLVQRALEHHPRPQHLAEIVLSGMLTTVPGPPGSYDFRPGVRDLLLRSLPRTARGRTREFLARVGGLIDERAGFAAGEFRAEARGGEETAFATVREETVRRLGGGEPESVPKLIGGRYRLSGRRGPSRRMWAAVDVRTDRRVVLHLYPEQAAPQERFLREARALAGLRHPNVVPVLDFGVDGEQPYLVAEFVDGVTVAELELGSGPGVSFGVFARLVRDVVPALDALHERGLVRGQAGWDGLLLRPDGTAVLSRFALGEQSSTRDPASDFHEFDVLLRELAALVTAPGEYGRLLDQIRSGAVSAREAAARWATARDPEPWSFRMLGPLRISLPGEPLVTVPIAEAQALLAMLLLRQGLRVTHEELAQGMWEQPPAREEAVRRIDLLATEVLRRLGPGTLATLRDGYALHAPGAFIDVHRCEELLADRPDDQDPRARRSRMREALGLFYGEPLDGIPGPAARDTRARLRALRLTLCAARAELDLELGDFEQAVADLTPLLHQHPHRVDFRRLHMLALMRAGRIAEATESYRSYAAGRDGQHRDQIDPSLQELYRELRAAPEHDRPTIVFEAPGLSEHPQARDSLGRAVTQMLSAGGLAPQAYEVLARTEGYVVLAEREAGILPVLDAVLRQLPEALAHLADPSRFRVTFWHEPWFADADQPALSQDTQTILDGIQAHVLVVVSPVLYEEFASRYAGTDASAFQPLSPDSPTAAPFAWYRPLHRPPGVQEPDPGPEVRDLVRGPYTSHDLARLESPDPGRTAIVHTRPDGPLTLLNPDRPWGTRPPRVTTYYEVDLSVHRADTTVTLPSSGGGAFAAEVELSWHVDDPVAFVRSTTDDIAGRLFEHLAGEAARITRRHPLRRADAAQHAVHSGLRKWPVPGLSVSFSVHLTPEGEMSPAPPPASSPPPVGPSPADLLRPVETVLIGFDGPLTRLFPAKAAREAALDLLSLVLDSRDPEDALAGRPLTGADSPDPPQKEAVHPLNVLRAFASHPVGRQLRARLDQLELRAAAEAAPAPHAASLLYALRESGRRVVVVTDCSPEAVHRFLEAWSLPVDSVHGRKERLDLLMPKPDCLLRAMRSPGAPARVGLVISSSAEELEAAEGIGLHAIAYAPTRSLANGLREVPHDLTVSSLELVVEAARSL